MQKRLVERNSYEWRREAKMRKMYKERVEELLSTEYWCTKEELNGKETTYSVNKGMVKPYIKIMAYRNCVVVCTSENIQSEVKQLLREKSRDEIFEMPYVFGQTIHYVPDGTNTENFPTLSDYHWEFLFGEDIYSLKGLTGFENSLAFDEEGMTPTKAVCVFKDKDRIIGVSGAVETLVHGLWEIGIDVTEKYRGTGIGTDLVKKLTGKLLEQDIIPFYSASVTNIGSQMVASRCGYIPVWVDTFGTVFDENYTYKRLVNCS